MHKKTAAVMEGSFIALYSLLMHKAAFWPDFFSPFFYIFPFLFAFPMPLCNQSHSQNGHMIYKLSLCKLLPQCYFAIAPFSSKRGQKKTRNQNSLSFRFYFCNISFTRLLTTFPSARPFILGFTAFITLPKSFIDVAPISAMVCSITF